MAGRSEVIEAKDAVQQSHAMPVAYVPRSQHMLTPGMRGR